MFTSCRLCVTAHVTVFTSYRLCITARVTMFTSYRLCITAHVTMFTSYRVCITAHVTVFTSYRLCITAHVTMFTSCRLCITVSCPPLPFTNRPRVSTKPDSTWVQSMWGRIGKHLLLLPSYPTLKRAPVHRQPCQPQFPNRRFPFSASRPARHSPRRLPGFRSPASRHRFLPSTVRRSLRSLLNLFSPLNRWVTEPELPVWSLVCTSEASAKVRASVKCTVAWLCRKCFPY